MINGRRQPSRGDTSRMTRECQVRFCERLGVKFPGLGKTRIQTVRAYVSSGWLRTCRWADHTRKSFSCPVCSVENTFAYKFASHC